MLYAEDDIPFTLVQCRVVLVVICLVIYFACLLSLYLTKYIMLLLHVLPSVCFQHLEDFSETLVLHLKLQIEVNFSCNLLCLFVVAICDQVHDVDAIFHLH